MLFDAAFDQISAASVGKECRGRVFGQFQPGKKVRCTMFLISRRKIKSVVISLWMKKRREKKCGDYQFVPDHVALTAAKSNETGLTGTCIMYQYSTSGTLISSACSYLQNWIQDFYLQYSICTLTVLTFLTLAFLCLIFKFFFFSAFTAFIQSGEWHSLILCDLFFVCFFVLLYFCAYFTTMQSPLNSYHLNQIISFSWSLEAEAVCEILNSSSSVLLDTKPFFFCLFVCLF